MSNPTPMANRPPIERIGYIDPGGNPCQFIVGYKTTRIEETEENGEFCTIPWLEVWEGENLVARFNQHKVEHIFYRRQA